MRTKHSLTVLAALTLGLGLTLALGMALVPNQSVRADRQLRTVDPTLEQEVATQLGAAARPAVETSKLTANDGVAYDEFGHVVGIDGDTIVVAAPRYNGLTGAAYVFTRNEDGADSWGQTAKLTASDAAPSDFFARRVAIDGDTIVVGAVWDDDPNSSAGSVYLFERNQGGADNWGQTTKITITDGITNDHFGFDVAISGDTLVVGAWGDDDYGATAGAAYVFSRNEGGADNWGQVTRLSPSVSTAGQSFGFSLDIDDDTIVAGVYASESEVGAAYVFARNQGGADNWGQVAILTPTMGAAGDKFGQAVAIDGDTIVVGAFYNDSNGSSSGSAYIYTRNEDGADNWGQVAHLTATDATAGDNFGHSVDIEGDTVVIGAYRDGDLGIDSGSAYVFARNQGGADNWGQVSKLLASDGAYRDYFGVSVGVSDDHVIVGAYNDDDLGNDSGSAYVFTLLGGTWEQEASPIAPDGMTYDEFGYAVAIDGDTVLVGAEYGDGAIIVNIGSAYLFARNQGGADNWGLTAHLSATDATIGDYFGCATGIDRGTAVVGAYVGDGLVADSGNAYVFTRNEGGADHWGQTTEIYANDGSSGRYFGYAVAIEGDTIVVGAPYENPHGGASGAAYVFERNAGGADNWGQTAKISPTLGMGTAGDVFGWSVDIEGNTIVVGAPAQYGGNYGSAYVFGRNVGGAGKWGQVAQLSYSPGASDDRFGWAVDLDGDTVVVGAPYDDDNGNNSGSAFVYARNQDGVDNWGQVTQLSPTDAAIDDEFGDGVAIAGDVIYVGAPGDDYVAGRAGSAYVFERNAGGGDQWGQVGMLTADNYALNDEFGTAVAASGQLVVVGAWFGDGRIMDSGSAYVYRETPFGVYLPLVLRDS
jgi:hypothetical protein